MASLSSANAGSSGSPSASEMSCRRFHAQHNRPRPRRRAAGAKIVRLCFEIIRRARLEHAWINRQRQRLAHRAGISRRAEIAPAFHDRAGVFFFHRPRNDGNIRQPEIIARHHVHRQRLAELHDAVAVVRDKIHFRRIVRQQPQVAARQRHRLRARAAMRGNFIRAGVRDGRRRFPDAAAVVK